MKISQFTTEKRCRSFVASGHDDCPCDDENVMNLKVIKLGFIAELAGFGQASLLARFHQVKDMKRQDSVKRSWCR